jgi:hypothetical protein
MIMFIFKNVSCLNHFKTGFLSLAH